MVSRYTPVIYSTDSGLEAFDGMQPDEAGRWYEKTDYDALAAELRDLSDKACAAVLVYRAALAKLTDGYKYSTEVVTIAREALMHSTEFTKETTL